MSPAVEIPPEAPPPPANSPPAGNQTRFRRVLLVPRDFHGPSWTSQDHYHQCGQNCICCRSRAGVVFNTCPVCDGERGNWWNRLDLADLMATHVMAECYEGDLPPDLELVLVFEEDDVVLTWPDVTPSLQASQPPSDEELDAGMMPPQG